MGFLKHIRSKSKIKAQAAAAAAAGENDSYRYYPATPGFRSHRPAPKLPTAVLETIFLFLCPHTQDENYDACEDSMIEDGCMLCDMRDLAHCAAVCRDWRPVVEKLLYRSIRIDPVHYCEKEIELSEKRNRRSFSRKKGDDGDAPGQRLALLSRTLRGNPWLAVTVQYLKMPFMTRETRKADLARTISVLPNLQYVDLPEGFYSDDPSCRTLREELAARCWDIRKMKYTVGSEHSFTLLGHGRYWQGLKALELVGIVVDPGTLLQGMASLPILHELKLVDLPWLDDSIFQTNAALPAFPALQKLSLDEIPNVTAHGVRQYLSRPEAREIFNTLQLNSTGVLPTELHIVLAAAPWLTQLSIVEEVTRPFPIQEKIPLMASRSLRTLHYEITSPPVAQGAHRADEGYYQYLSHSLLASCLPALRSLFVRYTDFHDSLLLEAPRPAFAGDAAPRPRFRQTMDIYSKGLDELEWNFTSITPPVGPGRRGSASITTPLSAHRMSGQLSPQWGGDARRSVVVGNGFGGFLAVPTEADGSTVGSGKGHARKSSRQDLWR
ncbi:hypothetical protein L228DRAFT_270284 [Xylona heveae TC161]|uniref:Uncharacterized protein n=1 Tax=Xylona heveae (strain CBS 132557 / TC161) TaxID=1328760 RepID=A0A165AB01_XYLHT|nr:hypothetical protein L228DRAFT_270284 [Xylona heveae TC161]KZF20191.1 hypothetical protein L228DRAFT_270284 [Xylona heveae TC161]